VGDGAVEVPLARKWTHAPLATLDRLAGAIGPLSFVELLFLVLASLALIVAAVSLVRGKMAR
jgi:hypothetical protein